MTVAERHPARLPLRSVEWIEQWMVFPARPSIINWCVSRSNNQSDTAISYWDAAILVAAEALGARTVYSEDLNDGQQYGQVRVVNPFSRSFLAM